MTTRALTLQHQTRMAVHIVIEDDTGMLIYSFLLVTSLFSNLSKACQFVMATKRELSGWATDLKSALDFTSKVFAIGFNSLVYGLGVSL